MANIDPLIQFAKKTIQGNIDINFPGSPDTRSLKSSYIELSISDSEGRSKPVGDLLSEGSRLILVGEPGAGKTTALKHFSIFKSEEFLEGKNNVLPIYIPLRQVSFENHKTIYDFTGLQEKLISKIPLLLLLDGLDELQTEFRLLAITMIAELSAQYPNSQIIIASRPAGLSPAPPDEFRYYHLESLSSVQAQSFVKNLSKDEAQTKAFSEILKSVSFLQGLSQNPLLIQLLWQVYRYNNYLPTVRSEIYQTTCDFLLSTWDSARGVSQRQNHLDILTVHNILEIIAFDAFKSSEYHIPYSKIISIICEYFETRLLHYDSAESILDQLLSSGIVIKSGPESISFAHLTFMEFYAAKRLMNFPRKLASLLVETGPIAKETILFASGMMLDVAPLVESAVDRRELILAANCLREGRTENRILEAYVLDQLQRELGSDLIKKLAGGVLEEKRPQPESIHSKLRRQFSEIRESNLPSNEKGKKFERFAERFFRQTFNVVELNRNTENGEIDLILENTGTDPFWTEWGGDIFVECKNWNSSRPLKETALFSNKVRMSRGKLGFFVSVAGFTEDALRTLKNQVADKDAPLIVPITGDEIEVMLDHREKFDLFFRNVIRKIKHLHKW